MKSQQRGRSGLLMDLHCAPKGITILPGDARLEKTVMMGQSLGALGSTTVGSVGNQELLTKGRVATGRKRHDFIPKPKGLCCDSFIGVFQLL